MSGLDFETRKINTTNTEILEASARATSKALRENPGLGMFIVDISSIISDIIIYLEVHQSEGEKK